MSDLRPPNGSTHDRAVRGRSEAGLERWVLAAWYGGGRLSLAQRAFVALMTPLGWWVGRVAAGRRLRAAKSAAAVSGLPPVIVIGNLTVGGTGKTPVVAWLAAALRARGVRVGLVSRGHGRDGRTERRVASGDAPAEVGDEPAWLATTTGCPMAVGHDRRAAVALLAGEVDVVLADDGLQHHALPRRLEVIVVDVTRPRPLGNGRCLPAGPLREPTGFVGSSQVVLCNHGALVDEMALAAPANGNVPRPANGMDRLAWAHAATVLHFGVRATRAVNLVTGEHRALAALGRAVAVAGIGNPERFFEGLRVAGVELLTTRAFPDHHDYAPGELAEWGVDAGAASATPLLMTAKDAVKCAPFALAHWWRVETELVFAPGDGERLLERVLAAAL